MVFLFFYFLYFNPIFNLRGTNDDHGGQPAKVPYVNHIHYTRYYSLCFILHVALNGTRL